MSLTSRLGLARTRDEPLALTTGAAPRLPRRSPGSVAARCPATPPRRPVLAAMERAVERDRPAFQVTRAAVLASVAASGAHLGGTDEMHFPGNGAARTADGDLVSRLPVTPRTSRIRIPPALDLLAMRADGRTLDETLPRGGVTLDPCAACGGATRVAIVDLAGDTATVECVACGLRRVGVAAPPSPR